MKSLILLLLLTAFLAACSSQKPLEVSGFPLEKGTTWVYSYEAYDPAPSDPEKVVKATYQLTDIVVDTETVSGYRVAHVKRDWKRIQADPEWLRDLSSQPREFWYIKDGDRIYQSNFPVDPNNIKTDQLILDYEFPLSVRKNWCLLPDSRNGSGEAAGCDFVGRRQVTTHGRADTPAGSFENCVELTDTYNGGNILQKFCGGTGIVYMKFDHAGTKFGFEQTLTGFSKGAP